MALASPSSLPRSCALTRCHLVCVGQEGVAQVAQRPLCVPAQRAAVALTLGGGGLQSGGTAGKVGGRVGGGQA